MTPRERYLRIASGEYLEEGVALPEAVWNETPDRWRQDGMHDDYDFGYDRPMGGVGVITGYHPPWDTGTVRDEGEHELIRDEYGIIKRVLKGKSSIPQFVSFPVTSRSDWEELKPRLDPGQPERYPDDIGVRARTLAAEGMGIAFGAGHLGGFFSFIRELCGDAGYYLFFDDPALVREMLAFQVHRFKTMIGTISRHATIDKIGFWEDMCYKNGSLISPAMFREFILEPYRETIDFARQHGVTVVDVDTDGYVNELIPLFLEAGVNMMHPFEVAAGSDVVALKREYGPALALTGGIDKRALAQSRDAVDREIDRVRPAYELGGYFPTVDHAVPPNVPFELFVYYLERRAALVGKR
jgi:hypothetical protein